MSAPAAPEEDSTRPGRKPRLKDLQREDRQQPPYCGSFKLPCWLIDSRFIPAVVKSFRVDERWPRPHLAPGFIQITVHLSLKTPALFTKERHCTFFTDQHENGVGTSIHKTAEARIVSHVVDYRHVQNIYP